MVLICGVKLVIKLGMDVQFGLTDGGKKGLKGEGRFYWIEGV